MCAAIHAEADAKAPAAKKTKTGTSTTRPAPAQPRTSHDIPGRHDGNADQIAYWNGPAGQRWAERQQVQDIVLAPVADMLIDRAEPKAGERVIDVGCGSGVTTIAFAQKVGAVGRVLGIDISGPNAGAGAGERAKGPAGRFRFG